MAFGIANANASFEATVTPIPYPVNGAVLRVAGLNSISCSDIEACVAVGNFRYDDDTLFYPLLVRTNGSVVESFKMSNASGLGDTTGTSYSTGIREVDCLTDGSKICWAIGGSNRDESGEYGTQSFLTRITSSSWEPTYVTQANNLSNSTFTSISCWSATACGIGGTVSFNSMSRAAVGISSGSNVSPLVLPLPDGISATSDVVDISCISSGKCLAIGRYYEVNKVRYFLSAYDGVSWTTQAIQLPPDALPLDATFESQYVARVACTELSGCLIVGQYRGQYGYMYAYYGVTTEITNAATTSRLSEGDTRSLSTSSRYIPIDIECFGGNSLSCLFSGVWGAEPNTSSSYFFKKFENSQFSDVVIT